MNRNSQIYIATIAPDCGEMAEKYGLGLECDAFCTAANLEDPAVIRQAAGQMAAVGHRVLHAPFNELCPAAIDPEVRRITRMRYEQAWAMAQRLGASRMVVHSGYIPLIYFPQWFVEQSVQFWKDFLRDKPADCRILLENVLEPEPDMDLELVRRVNDPRLKLCLDLGHANSQVSETPVEAWVRRWAPCLGHVHLHNNGGGSYRSILQPKHLIHLRKQGKTVGDQQQHAVFCQDTEIGKDPGLRLHVHSGKGIIQNHQRLFVIEGSGQSDPGLLAAGQADAAAANDRMDAIREFFHLPVNAYGPEHRADISGFSHTDIFLDGAAEQLRSVAQISDAVFIPPSLIGKADFSQNDFPLIGKLPGEELPKGGFSAGNFTGESDDLSRLCRKRHIGKQRLLARVGEGHALDGKCGTGGNAAFRLLLHSR